MTIVQKMELQNKYMGLASPKGDHSNCKRKAKLPSGCAGKGMLWPENDGRKCRKYGLVESITVPLQKTTTYYIKKKEDRVNADGTFAFIAKNHTRQETKNM